MTPSQAQAFKAVITISVAASMPFGAWATGETSLRAAIVMAVIGGLTALRNWLGDSPSMEAKVQARVDEQATSTSELHSTPPPGA